jgi:hypothetical protein
VGAELRRLFASAKIQEIILFEEALGFTSMIKSRTATTRAASTASWATSQEITASIFISFLNYFVC